MGSDSDQDLWILTQEMLLSFIIRYDQMAAGMDGFAAKPVDLHDFGNVIPGIIPSVRHLITGDAPEAVAVFHRDALIVFRAGIRCPGSDRLCGHSHGNQDSQKAGGRDGNGQDEDIPSAVLHSCCGAASASVKAPASVRSSVSVNASIGAARGLIHFPNPPFECLFPNSCS